MPKNQKGKTFFTKIKPYLFGILKGLAVFLVGFLIVALIMCKGKTDVTPLYYIQYFFIVLGGFVCAVATYKRVGGRGFLTGIISALPYSIVLLLLFAVLVGFNASGNIFLVLPLSWLGGFLGGITAVNTRI